MFVKEGVALTSKTRFNRLTVARRLVLVQIITMHVMHFFGNLYKDATFLETFRHIHVWQWSEQYYRRFYSMDAEARFAPNISPQETALKKSLIPHPEVRLGLVSNRITVKGEGAGY